MSKHRAQLVGVIASPADLQFALRMNQPPDLFELRLDCFFDRVSELPRKMSILPAPLIMTARHPAEGGLNKLSARQRGALIEKFLPHAHYIDVELRSVKALQPILSKARRAGVGRIISYHNFRDTPSVRVLRAKARSAKKKRAIIFKIATRIDKPAQLARLVEFMMTNDVDLAVSAMGIGKLGGLSRLVFAQLGSPFIYGSLRRPVVPGQWSIEKLRSALSTLKVGRG